MPREDLGKDLVATFFASLEGRMKEIFKKVKRIVGFSSVGHVGYEITPLEGVVFSSDSLYKEFADFYENELGCKVTLDEFPGDSEKNIPAMIEGMFVACNNNTIFLHIELNGCQLELSAWLRR